MPRRLRRISQPPIDRTGRRIESRAAWYGVAITAAGLALLVGGLLANHRVLFDDASTETMPEWGLVEAVTYGGITRVGRAGPDGAGQVTDTRPVEPPAVGPQPQDPPGRAKALCPT